MELLLHSIQLDWPVLLPIFLCSILAVAVAINRFSFYNKNKRDVVRFIKGLKNELVNNRLDAAKNLSIQFAKFLLQLPYHYHIHFLAML
jgi:hypothetical protein